MWHATAINTRSTLADMERETVFLNNDSSICMADDRHGQRAVNDIASSRAPVLLTLCHNVLFDTIIFWFSSLLETNGCIGKPRFTE
ncbi:hypothetical protein Tco_1095691 [Tanacetum coccineum]